jgi:Eukaryotic aspartyl protease
VHAYVDARASCVHDHLTNLISHRHLASPFLGTSIILGPSYDVKPILAEIGEVYANCSNVHTLPTVSFNISNTLLDVSPDFYVLRQPVTAADGSTQEECVLGIAGALLTAPFWIMGDPFLRAYTAVFDKSTTPPRVGFAKSINWN